MWSENSFNWMKNLQSNIANDIKAISFILFSIGFCSNLPFRRWERKWFYNEVKIFSIKKKPICTILINLYNLFMILTGSDTKKIPLIAKDSILSLSLHKYNRVDRSIAAVMAKGQPVCNACRFHTIFAFSTNMCEKIFPTIQKDVELKYNMVTTDSITSGETANIVQIYTFSWLKNFLIIEVSVSAQN